MSTQLPPLPVRRKGPPPLPTSPQQPSSWWVMPAFVLFLAVSSTVAGAWLLPALRRPSEATPPAEDGGDRPAKGLARAGDGVDEESNPSPEVPKGSPFDLPGVAPVLPSKSGPYALARAIDREIDRALAEAKVPASPLAGDAEFLRRAYLDITGAIPTAARARAFLESADPRKRSKLIDELLASPEYGRYMARLWADVLVKRDPDNTRGLRTGPFVEWLAGRLNGGAGWDKVVTEMITAEGGEAGNPATFFILANQDNRQPSPPKLTGAVGNLFLGVQIQCAECHKHPYHETWTQDDFWGMAAFFGQTRMVRGGAVKGKKNQGPVSIQEVEGARMAGKRAGKPGPAGLKINVPDPNDPRKVVKVAAGRFFLSKKPVPTGKAPYRPALAKWVTEQDNPFFAQAAVNRTWAHFFSRGLSNPIEEMTTIDKASHPELLGSLAKAFQQAGHDQKFLIRAICNSKAYQRTSRPLTGNRDDVKLYSHMPVKVMNAWQLVESLAVATGERGKAAVPARGAGGKRAMPSGGDALVRSLDTREADDEATDFTYGIPQMLKLMNTRLTTAGDALAGKLAREHPRAPEKALEEIYLTALARKPRPEELERLTRYVEAKGPAKGYSGAFWALLNCAEFVSNH